MRNSKKYLLLLLGLYLFVAPYSISNLAGSGQMKYFRLLVLAVMLVIGFGVLQRFGVAKVSRNILLFGFFHWFSALWCDSPTLGLFYKSMFLLSVGAGVLAAYSLHDFNDLFKALSSISFMGGCVGGALFILYLVNPEEAMIMDRLSVGGINANLVGITVAVPLMFSLLQLLIEQRFGLRLLHFVSFLILLWVLVATGSRAAVLMAVSGTGIMIIPFLRGRGMANLLFALIAILFVGQVAMVALEGSSIDTSGAERIMEAGTKNTRTAIWAFAVKRFVMAPGFGQGWLHFGSSSANMMNIYLQVLAEGGLAGVIVMFLCLAGIGLGMTYLAFSARFDPLEIAACKYLPLAIVTSVFVHGLFESSTLLGTTTNSMFLGLACGLVDKLSHVVVPSGPVDFDMDLYQGPHAEAWRARRR